DRVRAARRAGRDRGRHPVLPERHDRARRERRRRIHDHARRGKGDPVNELFASIRADLTDRRLLPLVALVGACLVAAVAYALLGGSGGSGTTGGVSNVPTVTPPAGIAVTGATPEHAVAETTDGFKEQSSGKARNPFDALPGAAAASAASSSSGTGGGSSS